MSYKIDWYIQDHVIAVRLIGKISAEEFTAIPVTVNELAKTGKTPIFLMIDTTGLTAFPALNLKAVIQKMGTLKKESQIAWLLVLSNKGNTAFNFLSGLGAQITGMPMRMLNSQEEAMKFILHHAPELAAKVYSVAQS